jgi:hypothetical protein
MTFNFHSIRICQWLHFCSFKSWSLAEQILVLISELNSCQFLAPLLLGYPRNVKLALGLLLKSVSFSILKEVLRTMIELKIALVFCLSLNQFLGYYRTCQKYIHVQRDSNQSSLKFYFLASWKNRWLCSTSQGRKAQLCQFCADQMKSGSNRIRLRLQ